MHQGRQWTKKLRTPTIRELEYFRLDDKTIDGMILFSLLRSGSRGPVRESFGAELHAARMTAIISGPRCGSTTRTPECGGRNLISRTKTIHVALRIIPEREKKVCTHPKEGPAGFRIKVFRPGNTCRSSVLYRGKPDDTTWGVVREHWQVPPCFLWPALSPHSQRGVRPPFRRPRARLPIRQQKRIPQNELEQRTTISSAEWGVRFMDNIIVEVLLALLRPFPVDPTRA